MVVGARECGMLGTGENEGGEGSHAHTNAKLTL
jgi:hypothetical protein